MKIGKYDFDTNNHTYVMGILNVTPDSFSDGGQYHQIDQALRHAEQMVAEGVDIIDIGGESTRPGYTKISDREEIARVVPVIEALKARFDVPLSLDTYKPEVAHAGLAAGIDLINDIWGLKYDVTMADVIAKYDAACCLMHNRENTEYQDFIQETLQDLADTVDIALKHGISRDKIILDPGVGFGKTYEHNLMVLNQLEAFEILGYPILLGVSKKSVIGLTLDVPAKERGAATIATTALAVMKGCAFVRVHDVKDNVDAVKMMEAILHG
ncbi:MAG: dihydropteroate synthase [Eubacterium sp.]|nr:dihydropteroate synthase [Eubacterium sp.]